MEDGPFRKQVDGVAENLFRRREQKARRLQQDIADREALVEIIQGSARELAPQLLEARGLLLEFDNLEPRAASIEDPVTRCFPDNADPITKFYVKRPETTEREVSGLFGKRTKLVTDYKYHLTHWGVRNKGSNVTARQSGVPTYRPVEGPGSAILWLPVEGQLIDVLLDNNDVDSNEQSRLSLEELVEKGLIEWAARRSSGGLYPTIYSSREHLRADFFLKGCLAHLAEFLGQLKADKIE